MELRRRNGSDSRCCVKREVPLTWRNHVDGSHPSVVAFDRWLASLAPFARVIELGEIEELMEAAAYGQLWESADAKTPIKAINEHPEIFELRRRGLSKALRFYHAEPEGLPSALVAIHRHIKTGPREQQREIEYAAQRYELGAEDGWEATNS
ncbi:hypothetical protein [Brevibacterium sp. 239c]|uniref:hypothetical protein n=1 Tax=Brevibacterium sp. 239c TaxID=1965356 RepID=UPI000C789EB1|nr:hypothetical protein [Brevibacterium sp. 239c]